MGTQTQIWRLENILEATEIESGMFDRLNVPRTAEMTGDINIHELGVEASGRLIFVNTHHSCLATVSPTRAFKPIWQPQFISKLAPEDRCHLNGVAMENGRAHYVTAFSQADSLEGWRGQCAGGGVLIDIDTDQIVADGLSMPHSPRVVGNVIYFVDSLRGALVRLDRASGKQEDVAICPGFARGRSSKGSGRPSLGGWKATEGGVCRSLCGDHHLAAARGGVSGAIGDPGDEGSRGGALARVGGRGIAYGDSGQ